MDELCYMYNHGFPWFGITVKLLVKSTSSISRTKSQNLNVSFLVWQLSLLNLLKPGVKLRMRLQAMLQLHLSYQQLPTMVRLMIEALRYSSIS